MRGGGPDDHRPASFKGEKRMFMARRARHNKRSGCGFTLVEILMTMVIFAACAGAFGAFYVTVGRMAESSRNLTQAMNDARIVLERMRDTAQAAGLTGAAGVTVVYAQGQNLAGALGLTSLTSENVTVTYANAGADPLPVNVRVQWQEFGRNRDVRADTLMTRR